MIIININMANDSTPFANSKKRVIHKSPKGKFYVMTADGKKSYGPKAAFKKAANGSMKTIKANNKVPNKLVPAARKSAAKKASPGPRRIVGNGRVTTRRVRTNKGVARGPQAPSFKKALMGGRKPRANKGVARGVRQGTLQRRMNANSKKLAARRVAVRKPRANKGVVRAPAARKMAQMITPSEAELYQMIFGTPMRRRVAAKKPAPKKPALKKVAKKSPVNRILSPLRMMLRSKRVKK
jgi:hypothetical protein